MSEPGDVIRVIRTYVNVIFVCFLPRRPMPHEDELRGLPHRRGGGQTV